MRAIFTTSFILLFGLIWSQSYFQQQVDVKIACTLNDHEHVLRGELQMTYKNNAPDTLSYIYMHLWPNAYKDRSTAFAQQKLRLNDAKFHFAEENKRGRLDSLDFTINDERTSWKLDEQFEDIARIELDSPLLPGQSIKIASPFRLKIPASFSRLGHVGESYQMTQWFPKPAVYDRDGWHPMPYLNMGEFYSEFGDYEVQITLPENYIVAATGTLQESAEHAYLNKQVARTKKALKTGIQPGKHAFPESSASLKTISFKAKKVHDFAWFADKRFYVLNDSVVVGGKKTETRVYFTNEEANLWEDAMSYVQRSVKFYSENVGQYPYPHATAVQSALSAGGGMEYPMITVIGLMGQAPALDNVITHEVGHNWFYGILAFNERDHVWLDEGINSYYDHRYMEEFYTDYSSIPIPPLLKGHSPITGEEYALLYAMRRRADQAPSTHSNKYDSELNYFMGGYEKPARAFKHLQLYLGTEKFDQIMKSFFAEWKFKHPKPTDFQNHFEQRVDENLDWFFNDLISSNRQIDYKVAGYNKNNGELKIKNKGDINAPIPVKIKSEENTDERWLEGFDHKKTLETLSDAQEISLDPRHITLDMYRKNNSWKADRTLKKFEPIQLKFLSRLENPDRSMLFVNPVFGWNNYDGFLLGAGFHNFGVLQKPFEFALLPAFGFKSGDLIGLSTLRLNKSFDSPWLRMAQLGINVKKFNYNYVDNIGSNSNEDDALRNNAYIRNNPYVELQLETKDGASNDSRVRLEMIHIAHEIPEFSLEGDLLDEEVEQNYIFRSSYFWSHKHAITPKAFQAELEYQNFQFMNFQENEYLKLSASYSSAYQFAQKKFFKYRVFAGIFLLNDVATRSVNDPLFFNGSNLALSHQARSDYSFDDYYFGRIEQDNLLARQVTIREGGFKLPLNQWPNSFSDVGLSNEYALGINLSTDLPINMPVYLPIQFYFDVGYYAPLKDSDLDPLIYSGGIQLNFGEGIFQVFFPFINSSDIRDGFDDIGGNYFRRVTFSFDLNKLDPTRVRNSLI